MAVLNKSYSDADIAAIPIYEKMYDFQREAVLKTVAALRKSTASLLIEAPTSSGKSLMIVGLSQWMQCIPKRDVLVISPTADITSQNYNEFIAWGNPASIFSSKLGVKSIRHGVIFGEPKTLLNAIEQLKTKGIGLIIIDEAISTTPTIKSIIAALKEINQRLRLVGFEARPIKLGQGYIYSLDENGQTVMDAKNPFWDRLIYKIPMRKIVEDGYVCPPLFFDSSQEIAYGDFWQTMTYDDAPTYDVSKLEKKTANAANFTSESLHAVYEGEDTVTDDVIAHLVKITESIRPQFCTLIFAGTLKHAGYIASLLPPDKTLIVDGDTDAAVRNSVKKRIARGDLWYLINYGVYTRGFSEWRIFAAAFLRYTDSVNLFEQMAGRPIRHARDETGAVMRNDDGTLYKPFGMIIDYCKNLKTHWPTEPYCPKPPAVSSGSVKNPIDVTCPLCGNINVFSAKPNRENMPIDDNGYFVNGRNEPLKNADGQPIAAHHGQRCQHSALTQSGVVRCSHRWNYRECPECGGENSLSARACVHCAAELVDPNEKLVLQAAALALKQGLEAESDIVFAKSDVLQVKAMATKNAIMLLYTIKAGGDERRITDFINPQSHKKIMINKTAEILREMGLTGLSAPRDIINAINDGKARLPSEVVWRKKVGSDFIYIRERKYANV